MSCLQIIVRKFDGDRWRINSSIKFFIQFCNFIVLSSKTITVTLYKGNLVKGYKPRTVLPPRDLRTRHGCAPLTANGGGSATRQPAFIQAALNKTVWQSL